MKKKYLLLSASLTISSCISKNFTGENKSENLKNKNHLMTRSHSQGEIIRKDPKKEKKIRIENIFNNVHSMFLNEELKKCISKELQSHILSSFKANNEKFFDAINSTISKLKNKKNEYLQNNDKNFNSIDPEAKEIVLDLYDSKVSLLEKLKNEISVHPIVSLTFLYILNFPMQILDKLEKLKNTNGINPKDFLFYLSTNLELTFEAYLNIFIGAFLISDDDKNAIRDLLFEATY